MPRKVRNLRNYVLNFRNSRILNSEGVHPLMARKRLEMLFVSGSSSLAAMFAMESWLDNRSSAKRSMRISLMYL